MDLELEAVDALGEACQPLPDHRFLTSQLRELGAHGGAGRLGGRQLDSGERDGAVDRVEDRRKLRGDPRGDLALRASHHGAARRLRGRFALALALTFELDDPGFARADPLTQGLDVEPCPHLRIACRLECSQHALARRRVQDRARRLEGVRELTLGRSRRSLGLLDGSGRL